MWSRLSILILSLFVVHSLDLDCMLRDCHCTPAASCVVPVAMESVRTVVGDTSMAAVAPDWQPPLPTAPLIASIYAEPNRLEPPRVPTRLIASPRAPPL